MQHEPTRRDVVRTTLATGLGAALAAGALARGAAASPEEEPAPAPPKAGDGRKLKILVLGGTVFLGPAIVDRALAHGHTVHALQPGQEQSAPLSRPGEVAGQPGRA